MYKVMLADDDYPVIELLSDRIDWEGLGFELIGAHEDGEGAWKQAQQVMPDLLVTDIGMPKMDGLELTARMKERKPNLRTVILSCHDEFQYARQAMRLNVQEYLLKDALDPEDLVPLLQRFKASMDEERQTSWEQSRLKVLVNETQELRKEKFFRHFIDQPILSSEQWLHEAREFGLLFEGEACLSAIGFIDRYRRLKQRFSSDETLRFAVGNVIEEVLSGMALRGLHIGYDARRSFFLFSHKPGIKTNIYDEAERCLKTIRDMLHKVLGVHMSFIVGERLSASPVSLKAQLLELLNSETQRFYLGEGGIVKRRAAKPRVGELFAHYDQASAELREMLVGRTPKEAGEAANAWISRIRQEGYAPEEVKDWTLKLLLDLKLKLHSLHFIGAGDTADTLHKEIFGIDSLNELRDWLMEHLQVALQPEGTARTAAGKRADVKEACRYVSLHLNRRISLEEVAEHLHLNASYFSRLFKKETGITFIEYVTRMKMERAKELLDQTLHSVGEICEQLGYDNQSYFIKTFKAHAGVTPMEYRR
ncbi:helix-turn-helix domain-containing protein [Cohnella lubricantis]|uniref:Helix-turn-helix domain-containing protein n=1 Tax=Cohnella lubricantis TaxID=2163172 RepID=A0A841TIH6_9BACL|nr:helix-turn-helix domain-containing protein [Cohnella lubricantis]MBB6679048.1 helix-turn-helix domain-containing protein [Cohnella lubricantis]MBP2120253.1 two-component system response regulator YesN [Cohnella lubricantis]